MQWQVKTGLHVLHTDAEVNEVVLSPKNDSLSPGMQGGSFDGRGRGHGIAAIFVVLSNKAVRQHQQFFLLVRLAFYLLAKGLAVIPQIPPLLDDRIGAMC